MRDLSDIEESMIGCAMHQAARFNKLQIS